MKLMDIERLTKSQIVLLTLLVSFVTSMATGIVTVSLMDQAPPVIPQTINRVVERTVEKVVPQESQTSAAATVVTREKTVTIKEADLIAQAVSRARGSSVRIFTEESAGVPGVFLFRGVVVADGYIVAPAKGVAIGETHLVPQGETATPLKVIAIDGTHNIALFESEIGIFSAAAFGNTPVLGQTVVALSGQSALKVGDGIITSLDEENLGAFETNIGESMLVSGAIITNIDGAIIGMYGTPKGPVISAENLIALVKSLSASNSEESATSTKELAQ